MEKIVKIPADAMSSIVESGARVQKKGCGVMIVRVKSGTPEPMDVMSDVLAKLAEANPNLVITATGITPVPLSGGVVFNGVIVFAPCEKFSAKV